MENTRLSEGRKLGKWEYKVKEMANLDWIIYIANVGSTRSEN